MKNWLFNRDPYFMVYHNPHITGSFSSPTNTPLTTSLSSLVCCKTRSKFYLVIIFSRGDCGASHVATCHIKTRDLGFESHKIYKILLLESPLLTTFDGLCYICFFLFAAIHASTTRSWIWYFRLLLCPSKLHIPSGTQANRSVFHQEQTANSSRLVGS